MTTRETRITKVDQETRQTRSILLYTCFNVIKFDVIHALGHLDMSSLLWTVESKVQAFRQYRINMIKMSKLSIVVGIQTYKYFDSCF